MKNPFDELLKGLKTDRDKAEFLKACQDLELGAADRELALLLRALQIYKAYYETIPGEIEAVSRKTLLEMNLLRDEMERLVERAAVDARKVSEWAEEIHKLMRTVEPKEVASLLYKRLLEDTLASVGGSVQALMHAYNQIDTATQKLSIAGYTAAEVINDWQALSLRRIWASAFLVSFVVSAVLLGLVWVMFLRP